jgi:uncharacterized membrane protein
MIRTLAEQAGLAVEKEFRWRGGEVSRVEGFSDAVFAFSVTLLVVSLEVPKTFNELMAAMQGFIAFTLTFALLLWVWYNHYLFFRRYGLQDIHTIVLNALLLFVVLFYIYPLKFLATLIVSSFLGADLQVRIPGGERVPMIESGQTATLMIVYGIGFLLVFLCFALLYVHAYRMRINLELNESEIFDTRSHVEGNLIESGVGGMAVILALFIGNAHPLLSSMPYWLIGPFMALHGSRRGKKKRTMQLDGQMGSGQNQQ